MKQKSKIRKYNFLLPLLGLSVLLSLTISCESPSLTVSNTTVNKIPETKADIFQRDLETMKTAGFDYVFVFRRKDGGVLDGGDKGFLKTNSPASINRFILSDDDKAVIAGSGFEFPAENLENLRKRFDIENFSTPKETNKPKDSGLPIENRGKY